MRTCRSSSSISPELHRAVQTGVRSWNVSNGVGVSGFATVDDPALGPGVVPVPVGLSGGLCGVGADGNGDSVNEYEWLGALFLITAMSRVRSDVGWVGWGTCACECGVSMKCVTADCTVARGSRLCCVGGDRETESSFAWTDRGDGGLMTTAGPCGGVGG